MENFGFLWIKNLVSFFFPLSAGYLFKMLHFRYFQFHFSEHIVGDNRVIKPLLYGLLLGGITFAIVLLISVIRHEIISFRPPVFDNTFWGLFLSQIITCSWEELFFRGFLFLSLILQTKKFLLSAFISSILFSLLHYQTYSLIEQWYIHIGIIATGIVLCYLYLLSKSLWVTIGMHLGLNLAVHIITYTIANGMYDSTNFSQSILMVVIACIIVFYNYRSPERLRKIIQLFTTPNSHPHEPVKTAK